MATEILNMPTRWAAAWTSSDHKAWLTIYAQNATYTDHAFRIRRTGHELLEKHHEIWHTANPDFVLKLDPAEPVWWRNVDEAKGNGQCIFRTINTGTFKGDLPRGRKATGKAFEFSAVVELTIKDGLIADVQEWYTVAFDDSVPIARYG